MVNDEVTTKVPTASVTLIVSADEPAVVAVPEITPVPAFKTSPAGNVPVSIVNVFEPEPPDVAIVSEYERLR